MTRTGSWSTSTNVWWSPSAGIWASKLVTWSISNPRSTASAKCQFLVWVANLKWSRHWAIPWGHVFQQSANHIVYGNTRVIMKYCLLSAEPWWPIEQLRSSHRVFEGGDSSTFHQHPFSNQRVPTCLHRCITSVHHIPSIDRRYDVSMFRDFFESWLNGNRERNDTLQVETPHWVYKLSYRNLQSSRRRRNRSDPTIQSRTLLFHRQYLFQAADPRFKCRGRFNWRGSG